ncbi:MAG TPA: carbohydrate ABC transporter permease [Mycobacteriales bacterium]|jgi:multiple sugar transport system permease protein|nr:carbohydrate ABC transporter permease [Mycobacteriales bacterium]
MATTTQTPPATVPIVRNKKPRTGKSIAATVAVYTALIILSLLFLLPFYLIIRNALSSEADLTSPHWTFFPHTLHWSNFKELFTDIPMGTGLKNSAIIGIVQTGGQILLASMAGYGLARIPYKHANKVFYTILITLMIPGAVTFVPSYVLVSSLGWVSSLRGLIIPGLFSGFAAFLFRQYFLNFPKELEEAGRVDGLGHLGAYWRIVVPNSLNFFAAIAVITFIGNWNAFLWPLVIGQSDTSQTVQVVMSTFITAQTINLHELFAAAAVAITPLVLIFIFLQRYLIQGVAQSGIKG